MGVHQLDYKKLDAWIKKNPGKGYPVFVREKLGIKASSWSFRKRRALVLGLPMTPSMKPGYRPNSGASSTKTTRERSSRWVYTTVWSITADELKGKTGLDAASHLIAGLNKALNLHLEIANVSVVGEEKPVIEIRRYNR